MELPIPENSNFKYPTHHYIVEIRFSYIVYKIIVLIIESNGVYIQWVGF